jgi:gliding motility-associated-like protein
VVNEHHSVCAPYFNMKPFLFLVLLISSFLPATANHIAGGELTYKYVGRFQGVYMYELRLRLFRECSSNGQQLSSQYTTVGIYDNGTLELVKTVTLKQSGPVREIAFTPSSIPCLLTDVDVCYQVAEYVDTAELTVTGFGYTAAWQACCRADSIANIADGLTGSTYIAKMPGTAHRVNYNSSARFVVKDTVVVCAGKPIDIDFSATDEDGDTLEYEFSGAFNAQPGMTGNNPPPKLLLAGVTYNAPLRDNSPMGPGIKVGLTTGVISGIAPAEAGSYVVNVTVTEVRNGLAIASHNKDFLIKVQNCEIIEADLKPDYSMCNDFRVQFKNESPNPAIETYLWHFGSGNSTSTLPAPEFTYSDTGNYQVKLIVTGVAGCIDSGFTTVHVFPPFVPQFTYAKACQDSTVQFANATVATYGNINSYSWNFGDTSTLSDTSHVANPGYSYDSSAGFRNVKLIVTSTKGCVDSITKAIEIIENPASSLPFHDTTICNTDTVALSINTNANVAWSPPYNIINGNTANALFHPAQTSTYYVSVSSNDCVLRDTIKINVLNFITVDVGSDTSICVADSIRLHATGQGIEYNWSPAAGMSDITSKDPVISPSSTTRYFVTAKLGHCINTDSVLVSVASYATANAGNDTTICFGEPITLRGSVYGSPFRWQTNPTLSNPNLLNTVAYPVDTTAYVLTVSGAPGCPKPVSDTIVVNVVPRVQVFAGNDTMMLQEQPLQLNAIASASTSFHWSPAVGLSNANIANPIFSLRDPSGPFTYTLRATTAEGCIGEDEVKITVFKNDADIYVPSAFTPNKDGKNDKLKAIPVGIKTFHWFRIYNRYGQLLFQTTNPQLGWDGMFNNLDQPTGAFIFAASGMDIHGKAIMKKGSFVLIR